MKRTFTIFAAVLWTAVISAQAPEKMSYQAVIRNSSGNLVTNQEVGLRVTILQNSIDGTLVYQEIYNPNPETNNNGLLTIEIGAGVPLTGTFSEIDWSGGPYFIKTETDPSGGTTYTISGTGQLLSVPYALHSKSSDILIGEISESQITDLQEYLTEETDPSVPTGTQTGQMQYWNGSAWVTVAPGTTGQVLTFTGGVPKWTTPGLNDVENPITGKIWMDRNLGASRVALSSTDAAAYGGLYQWGRATDGHEIRTSGTTSELSSSDTPGHGDFILAPNIPYDWRSTQNDNLWQGVSGINNPCPSGYRLPTEAEWEAEHTSWSSNNAAGAFASPLKLPVAGNRLVSDGSLDYVGSIGQYWSSTVDGTRSRILYFLSSNAAMGNNGRARGLSVRCLKD